MNSVTGQTVSWMRSMSKPTLDIRLRMRERPQHQTPVLYETWQDLLFLHWEYDPQTIQRTLPKGLYVDTFEDRAYLGVIPFFMRDVRPRAFPSFRGIANFLEVNVRTYVYDANGAPGVWFYSLDASHFAAVITARLLFNLPYFFAAMTVEFDPDRKEISFSSCRSGTGPGLNTHFKYHPASERYCAAPGTLEFFLVERYLLFAYSKNILYSGRVWHNPYSLAEAEVSEAGERLLCLDGFQPPQKKANHAVMSHGVDVEVYGLKRINKS